VFTTHRIVQFEMFQVVLRQVSVREFSYRATALHTTSRNQS
jgi:hypothetical protein